MRICARCRAVYLVGPSLPPKSSGRNLHSCKTRPGSVLSHRLQGGGDLIASSGEEKKWNGGGTSSCSSSTSAMEKPMEMASVRVSGFVVLCCVPKLCSIDGPRISVWPIWGEWHMGLATTLVHTWALLQLEFVGSVQDALCTCPEDESGTEYFSSSSASPSSEEKREEWCDSREEDSRWN